MASPILPDRPRLGPLPPSDPTPEQLAEWLSGGVDVLRDAAQPIRLWDVIRSGRSDPTQKRRLLGRLIDGAKAQLSGLARWLADNFSRGTATLNSWWRRFAGIAATHGYAGAMTMLGTASLSPADRKAADDQVQIQLAYLMRFREQVRSGAQPLHALKPDPMSGKPVISGRFVQRSELYGDALWGVGQGVFRARMIREGYTFERRILHGSHSCEECPALARKGWMPTGSLPAIGTTTCKTNCRCSWEWSHDNLTDDVGSPVDDRPD